MYLGMCLLAVLISIAEVQLVLLALAVRRLERAATVVRRAREEADKRRGAPWQGEF